MARRILPPSLASKLAKDVYALSDYDNLEKAYEKLNADYQNSFVFNHKNLITGKTGGPSVIKCRTAFGFCLIGKNNLNDSAIILFRGTQYLADWLTNFNVGISRSAYQQPVHDGFSKAFKSMKPQINDFVTGLRAAGINNIHCIGHSLGGALATLCGEWLKAHHGFNPQIYSFGSPRVGLKGFAHKTTSAVGANNIFRAYHKTDIVPCIPIWPYIHTPDDGTQYYLPSPGLLPGPEYHSMDHYVNSVSNKSWKALSGIKPEKHSDASIKQWLKDDRSTSISGNIIGCLQRAMIWVLKKCLRGAEWIISSVMGTQATITDQLAFILKKGIDLSKDISGWVLRLMRKILRFLGGSFKFEATEMTVHFIRTTLIKLHQKLNIMAQTALSNALVKGRAV